MICVVGNHIVFRYSSNFTRMTNFKHLRNALLFAICAALMSSCNPATDDGFQVVGTILDHPEGKVYLDRVVPTGNFAVDSTTTDAKGSFVLCTHAMQEGIYAVRLPNRQSMLLYAMPDKVVVDGNAGQFALGKVSGNKGTAILRQFEETRGKLRGEFVRQMRTLKSISRDMNPKGWSMQEMKADQGSEVYREYVMAFADTVSLPEIAHHAVLQLNVEGDFYYMQQYVDAQKAKQVRSPYVDFIESTVLDHGDYFLRYEATDFKMATLGGDSVSLSSLRGKVVYFYIWASYCGMSRMENERLATWYDAHRDAGIEIVSYAIDLDDKAWRQAVADDSLHWPAQMRGDNEWTSPEIAQFGVKNIPISFVLDAKGIIRTKAMHASELARDYAKLVERWGVH
jgi:alkyl hydroperoxide reductase subunit AhpC